MVLMLTGGSAVYLVDITCLLCVSIFNVANSDTLHTWLKAKWDIRRNVLKTFFEWKWYLHVKIYLVSWIFHSLEWYLAWLNFDLGPFFKMPLKYWFQTFINPFDLNIPLLFCVKFDTYNGQIYSTIISLVFKKVFSQIKIQICPTMSKA